MAKILLALFSGVGVLCAVLAIILASSIRSLDLQILDIYFVIFPRYLLLLSAALLVAAFALYKTAFSQ